MTNSGSLGGAAEDARIRAGRISVSYTFLAFGMMIGTWFIHIPVVAARLALEPAILGLALLNIGLGALVAPPLAGILVAAIGSRLSCRIFAAATIIALLALILAPHVAVLFACTLATGIMAGGLNVAINTQASEVEVARGRPTMSSFHGFFSLGGLIAASIGAYLFSAGWGDGRGAVVIAAVLLAGMLSMGRYYLPDRPRAATAGGRRAGFVVPGAALLGIAALAFLCNMVEGAAGDWSALFLIKVKSATASEAATGYAMFALAMTLSRFGGGPLVERLGGQRVVALGGALIATGMAIVVLAPWPTVSAAGYLVIGIGAANVSPMMISAAGRMPGVVPAAGVATVSSALASGLLLGPPIIGLIAQALGLTAALSIVGAFGIVIAAGALRLSWAPTRVAAG